jgi:nicotinamide phosphoribosyltransferase
MGVPMFAITNTHPDFAWLPQYLESLLSCEMWHGIVVATVADRYRQIVDRWYEKTVVGGRPETALSSFDMRGEESFGDAVKAGAAWATSFVPCATVSTALYLKRYYGAEGACITGSPSTEHAVMCSNYAVDGDEVTLLRRLLTEIYPEQSFSAVLDSYDYWHMVREVLPTLKDEIMAHKGCFLVRGDSGDPVEVATKTVFALWDIFGGSLNDKGYKVLDPHVKAIYGDGITLQRCEEIYSILAENGFAASNVALGVGSYSMQAVCVDGKHYPFTRDTFNIAIKATYIEVDKEPYMVQKSPKVSGAHGETLEYFKKSAKGCVLVKGEDGKYVAEDGLTLDEMQMAMLHDKGEDGMYLVFNDGRLVNEAVADTLPMIRERLDTYRRKLYGV